MEEKENIENWNEQKGKKNTSTIIIILLVIIILLLGGFIFLKRDQIFNSNKTTNESAIKEPSKTSEETKPVDLTKCLNCNENWVFNDATTNDSATHFTLKNDNNHVSLSINWKTFCEFSGASSCSNDTLTYEIKGINKTVESTIVGGSGQSIEATTFYYLLEDGTVEYTKLFAQKEDNQGNKYFQINYSIDRDNTDQNGNPTTYFASQGSIAGVKGIVKLYNVSVSVKNGSGWSTTIGAKADGSFYDLKID